MREYGLLQLHSRHRKVIRLAALGIYKQREIAEITGLSRVSVTNILSTTLAKAELEKFNSAADLATIDVAMGFREDSALAQAFLREVLLDEEEETKERLRAAKEILDRGGYPASKIVEHAPRIGDAEIKEIKLRAKTNALKMGLLSEATIVEEFEDETNER